MARNKRVMDVLSRAGVLSRNVGNARSGTSDRRSRRQAALASSPEARPRATAAEEEADRTDAGAPAARTEGRGQGEDRNGVAPLRSVRATAAPLAPDLRILPAPAPPRAPPARAPCTFPSRPRRREGPRRAQRGCRAACPRSPARPPRPALA